MKRKKNRFIKVTLIFIIVILILFLGLFLVGCTRNNKSSANISLDFLITPEEIVIHSNDQLKNLNEIEAKTIHSTKSMNEKYDDISKMSEEDIKIQEELVNKVMNALDSGKVIANKVTIENIFNQIRDLKGVYVDSFQEEVISRIDLIEDPETESVVSLDNAYLRMFMLLEDGNMVIPKGIMSKSTTGLKPTGKIEYIKVKLPEELKYELEELAKD